MNAPSAQRIRVLVVDDDEVDRIAVRRALAVDAEFELVEVESADAAIDTLTSVGADIVVCDLSMPGHDGAWLLGEVRRREVDVPVVMLTGQGDELTAVAVMKAGAADYLVKGDSVQAGLTAVIRQQLRIHAAEQRTRAAVDALRVSEERLRLALEAARLGTWDADLRGNSFSANERCHQMFGLAPGRTLTREMTIAAIHPEDRERVMSAYDDAEDGRGEDPRISVHRIVGIDDEIVRWVRATGRLERVGGIPVRSVGILEDVTEQRRLEELARRRAEFEQQLIGIVSHDLRNPISAMVMGASLLTHRLAPDSSDGKVAHRIVASGQRASRLIHDLLDFTRARGTSGIPILVRSCDLHEVCRQTIDELAVNYPERDIVFEHHGNGEGLWDPERIAQILANLVTNALSYGAPDTPVTVRSRGGNDRVAIEVHNLGEPIRPEALATTIFEPFTREQRAFGSERGIGLGLFIVREIVRAHHGTVRVESNASRGTTFFVELPHSVVGS